MAVVGMQAQSEKKSQWAVKPMVGATYSKLLDSYAGDMSYRFGFAAGAEVLFQPDKLGRFGLSSGILYSKLRTEVSDVINANVTFSYSYLDVPLLVNYEIAKGLKIKTGLQLGIRLKANYKGEYPSPWDDDAVFNMKSQTKPVCLSIPIGISYDLPYGFVADLRYSIGITPVQRYQENIVNGVIYQNQGSRGHHSTFMLTLGYQIKW